VFVRGHQTALGSYVGIALAPALGGGVAGVRRADALLALLLILGTYALGRRLGARGAVLGALIFASSAGLLWIARTGYGFELLSRVALLAALGAAAPVRRFSTARALAVGAAAGVAILCKATVAVPLALALAVLLADARRPIGARALAALGASAIALPLVVHAVVAARSPFREDAAPLAHFALAQIPARTAAAWHQFVLQSAWLGDASTVLRPFYSGGRAPAALVWAALPAALVLGVAALRWRRGRASEPEKMFLSAAPACVLAAAWMYPGPDDFAFAFGLEPLFALAAAAQLSAVDGARARTALIAVALALRAHGAWAARALESHVESPLLSARTQRAAVAALAGRRGEILTLRYHQVGVLEFWSGGALRPAHAWPVFAGGVELTAAWRALFAERRPEWILFSDGETLTEADQPATPALRAALVEAARPAGLTLAHEADFPTESGAPGWSLWRLSAADPTGAAPPPSPPADPAQRSDRSPDRD
jgi:hypothetical protein